MKQKMVDGVLIDLTSEEIANIESEGIAFAQEQTRLNTEQKEKQALKASALAKLTALGLTETEITALIGI
jgi:hypothetical protein